MHWLARFLHTQPATRVLCLETPRAQARNEIVRLLRSWRKHGICDIKLDRENSAVSARVDQENYLRIKPVGFVIELFIVLWDGKDTGSCAARFTQTHGAASSFRKVVKVLNGIFKERNMLVTDPKKKKELTAMICSQVPWDTRSMATHNVRDVWLEDCVKRPTTIRQTLDLPKDATWSSLSYCKFALPVTGHPNL